MHVRLDPAGKVHLLFGIRYSGSWSEYEDGMQQLVPIFCGGEVEVTSDLRGLGKKCVISERYMQSFGTFQTEDIIACIAQLRSMFHPGGITQNSSSSLIERCDTVVNVWRDEHGHYVRYSQISDLITMALVYSILLSLILTIYLCS
jgi:hypothetical protein